MSVETISYLVTFILTAGITALALVVSVQLFQQFKKSVLAQLLYQQIFLFSFLIYSIWGNILLKSILSDIQISTSLSTKLSVFIPMIGIPFMIVSWFMLLKIAFELNGINNSKVFGFIFFPTLVVLILVIDFLIYLEIIPVSEDADLFIVRMLTAFNFIMYLIFSLVFLIYKKRKYQNESGFHLKASLLLLLAVFISSAAMSFFNQFDFISICISILLAFAAAAFLPMYVYLNNRFSETTYKNMNFDAFCHFYEISKREAEIVLEICKGLTNKAIADKLFITLQTVKDHNHRIFTKTGVKSRVQLTNLVREKTGQKL